MNQTDIHIVQMCSFTSGGAGKAAYRLHQALKGDGYNVTFLTLNSNSSDATVKIVSPSGCSEPSPGFNPALQSAFMRWQHLMSSHKQRPPGLEMFSDAESDVRLSGVDEIRRADIIHLHWMSGMLDYEDAVRAFHGKRVVWTLHDMNPFTGGCHYAGNCTKYRESCGACPQMGSDVDNDISRSVWESKKRAYQKLDITVVTPSRWLAGCAMQSALFRDFPVISLPNGVPADIFSPSDRDQVRVALSIAIDAKVILFGADSVYNTRKGFSHLITALNSYRPSRDAKIILVTFGAMDPSIQLTTPYQIVSMGSIHDEHLLGFLYGMADLLVIPSLEDNLPNIVLESMACGTPVLGYNIGGIPDMIEHKKTGYLAEAGSVESLMEGIDWLLFEGDRQMMREACRQQVVARYALPEHASRFGALYQRLLARPTATVSAPELIVASTPPKISIVTPSFNQAPYLEECIESVLGQGYPNLEYVIMDGGSTDGSAEIIKKYEKYLTYWQSRPDGGQYRAISEGFRHTTGEIMAWINSDDKYHPLAFAKAASIFVGNPDVRWLTGRMSYWDADGNLDRVAPDLPVFSRLKNLAGHFNKPYLQQESTFWRRSLWEDAGGALFASANLAGDLELWCRFFRHDALHTVDTLLGGYRFHGDQRGIEQADAYLQEAWKLIEREREVFRDTGGELPGPPPVLDLRREYLATFVVASGIRPDIPSARSCWRHYTENLIGITNVLAREKRLEPVPFFENEMMLFGLVKPSAVSLMADRLKELEILRQRVQQLNREGDDYVRRSNYELALASFREALLLSPFSFQTAVNLVLCLWRKRERGEVFELLAQVLAEHPHERTVVMAAAEILMECNACEQALRVCDEYLVTNPHDSEVKSLGSVMK